MPHEFVGGTCDHQVCWLPEDRHLRLPVLHLEGLAIANAKLWLRWHFFLNSDTGSIRLRFELRRMLFDIEHLRLQVEFLEGHINLLKLTSDSSFEFVGLILLRLLFLVDWQKYWVFGKVEFLGEYAFSSEVFFGERIAQSTDNLEETLEERLRVCLEDLQQHLLGHCEHIDKYNHILHQLISSPGRFELLEMVLNDTHGLQGHCQCLVDFPLPGVQVGQIVQAKTYQHWINAFDLDVFFSLFQDSFGLLLTIFSR